MAPNDWRNKAGQLVYDPTANGGKGDYTVHATNNERKWGAVLQSTETGKKQFDKLVNSKAEIRVDIDQESGSKRGTDGSYEMGKTVAKSNDATEYDITTKTSTVVESTVIKADISLNVATIDDAMKDIASGTLKNDNLKGLSFLKVLAVVFGHEIEHTTDENAKVAANGGDKEAVPTETGYKIAKELKEKNNNLWKQNS